MTLYLRSRELDAVEWRGNNAEELIGFCGSENVQVHLSRIQLDKEGNRSEEYKIHVHTPHGLLELTLGWWVCRMEDGTFARMSPDYVREYCSTTPDPSYAQVREYYQAYQANLTKLRDVVDSVEDIAYRMGQFAEKQVIPGFKQAYRAAAADLRRELIQMICNHPESSLRFGSAECWCVKCNKRMDPDDYQKANRELLETVVKWCKCDSSLCPVHTGPNADLPIRVPQLPRTDIQGAMATVDKSGVVKWIHIPDTITEEGLDGRVGRDEDQRGDVVVDRAHFRASTGDSRSSRGTEGSTEG